jgi:hypothetical protein
VVIPISNVLVNNNGGATGTSGFTQSETTIALARNGNVVVGYNDSGSNNINSSKFTGWSVSTDGGATFTDKGELPTSSFGDAGDPALAVDNTSGRVYLSTLGFNNFNSIPVFRSDDNGQTFQAPVNGAPGIPGGDLDKEWLAVDNFAGSGQGNVYLVVRDFGSTQGIRFFRSTDGGTTWGPSGGVLLVPASGGNVQGAFVSVGPDHAVYVFWYDNRQTTQRLMMRKSTDQGATFGPEVLVTNLVTTGVNGDLGLAGIVNGSTQASAFRTSAFPHVAVNPVNGSIYVVYDDKGTGPDKGDIFLRQSTDGGTTWGAALKVNDDTTSRDQFMPTLAVTPNGARLGVFWYDRRLDPADNLIDRFGQVYAVSGATLTPMEPNFRITDVSFLPEFGRDSLIVPTYMGDYDTATADDSFFYVASADNRDDLSGGGSRKDPNVRYSQIVAGNLISGTKYNDLNGDGVRDPGEPGLAGWTIYLDLHHDGMLHDDDPQTVTDVVGNYDFTNLDPGTYTVREVPRDGWARTAPADGSYEATIVDETTTVTGLDFGNTLLNPSSLSGTTFHDLNGNGAQDLGEPGLAGWRIYLDANNNGVLDLGERFADTDAGGNYTIAGLEAGTYTVREVPQAGWSQSAPAGGSYTITLGAGNDTTGLDFGNFRPVTLSGQAFHDVNGNGIKDPGEPLLAAWTVFADLNNNGVLDPGEPSAVTNAQGNFTVANVPPGTVVLRQVVQPNWVPTLPVGGAYTLTVISNQNQNGLDFGNESGTVTGTTFNDLNGNGVRDAGEPGLSAWTVFVDLNNNGVLDGNEPRAVTGSPGSYIIGGLAPGTYTIREVSQAGWVQTAPAGGFFTVTIADPSTTLSAVDFGNFRTATVSGNVYNDLNGNGSRDAGEPGLANWLVYDDLNNNGVLDPGEPSTVSGSGGSYSLANVGPGTHRLRELLLPGWVQTQPSPLAGGAYVITPTSGQNVSGRDFGNRLAGAGSIAGTVFNDLNADGNEDAGEPGLSGWTVFADLNNNGVLDPGEPSTGTNAQGHYTLSGLPAGTYTLREVLQSGWIRSAPPGGSYSVTLAAGENVTGYDFGNYRLATVTGTVFNDLNADGIKQASEPGLSGWTVYADLNNNGVLDPGEPSTTSSSGGSYTLSLVPGTHLIREVLRPNWAPTGPAEGFYSLTVTSGQSVTGRDFGNQSGTVTGNVFRDTNGNGIRDSGEPGLSVWTVFADLNNNGVLDPGEPSTTTDSQGNYVLGGLPAGDVAVREQLQSGWVQTAPAQGAYTVSIADVTTRVSGRDFGVFALAIVSGTVFNDLNGDGIKQANEPGLSGWTVFVDLNNNGVLDPGEPSTTTFSDGSYTLFNVGPGPVTLREILRPNWAPTAPAEGFYVITPTSGQNISGRNFGNQSGTVTGNVFNDLNGNGIKDAGEPGLSFWTVYADLNNNGVLDPGEPSTTTDSQGNYVLGGLPAGDVAVREQLQSGWVQTAPAQGAYTVSIGDVTTRVPGLDFGLFRLVPVSGNVYQDLNNNGMRDPGEPGLGNWILYDDLNGNGIFDPGEPSAVTDSSGNYTLSNVGPGTHYLREVLLPGWVQTQPSPSTGGAYVITPTSGQNVTGRDFGNALVNPASLSGTVFHDLNGNGMQDDGEPGLSGWTIYLDLNNNGTLDANEPRVVSDAQGNYSISGLLPGTYAVREVAQTGWFRSAPAAGFYTVTVTTGQGVTGLDFGNYQLGSLSGSVFNDLNGNGVRDSGEPGLPGWVVYLDLNNNGQFDGVPVPNGGFETGDFSNWVLAGGPNTVRTASFGSGPTEGTYDALVSNASGVSTSTLESFLGVTPGSLNGLGNGTVVNGSAIQQTVTVAAGLTLTFDWNFLTNETIGSITFDDFAFISLAPVSGAGTLQTLARVRDSSFIVAPSSTGFGHMTGFHTFTYTFTAGGTFTLSVGAVNVGDSGTASAVLVDNFQLGEPSRVTDAQGNYTFGNLPPGTYVVREVPQDGWVQTAPPDGFYAVALQSGQSLTGYDFGNMQRDGGAPAPGAPPRRFAGPDGGAPFGAGGGAAGWAVSPVMAGQPAAEPALRRPASPRRTDWASLASAVAASALAAEDLWAVAHAGRRSLWLDDLFAGAAAEALWSF